MLRTPPPFSDSLSTKIALLKSKRPAVSFGRLTLESPLILAPMAAITTAPFRLLMNDLGAGACVSELVSCHGINYQGDKTLQMLNLDPRETCTGLQLFGEDAKAIARAAVTAQERGPKFIDINMGCPVRKVVRKGGGAALLKEIEKIGPFLATIRKAVSIPLSIKIRTGPDSENLIADRIVTVAMNEGVEFVAIHGRTAAQKYSGFANWNYMEAIASSTTLPIIGNGDLSSPDIVREKLKATSCKGLMIGRGATKHPFIFLLPFTMPGEISFSMNDSVEIIQRFAFYLEDHVPSERVFLVQFRKLILSMAAGLPGASHFRGEIFRTSTVLETMNLVKNFFKDGLFGIERS
jgi:nifR3 family TIM-barrel protein